MFQVWICRGSSLVPYFAWYMRPRKRGWSTYPRVQKYQGNLRGLVPTQGFRCFQFGKFLLLYRYSLYSICEQTPLPFGADWICVVPISQFQTRLFYCYFDVRATVHKQQHCQTQQGTPLDSGHIVVAQPANGICFTLSK